MLNIAKRLVLGIALIVVASGILLATDQERRPAGGPKRIALMQHASTAVLDDGVAGAVAGLAEHGYRDGDNVRITFYNAHGDVGTATTIAQEILHGPYDLVVTISTASLQAVANANKERQMRHVFGVVADPFVCGIGLDRAHPERHPPYLAGQGIFLPVEECFRLARQMNPELKTVGVAWNPAEVNSLAFTTEARKACKKLGITLLEANVDNSAGALEAIQSLISRGVQAIWVGGDVTVQVALDSVIATAAKAGIPVFTISPGKPDRGTLFDVGLNYFDCGKLTGALAADILHGADPASFPIVDVLSLVPRRLIVNRRALNGLKETWRVPDDIVRQANTVVDDQGIHEQQPH